MDVKGYVICLLKYTVGTGTGDLVGLEQQSGNKKTVCLGYFGRADAVPVYNFKDYMRAASENDAEFIGGRKQLMLYSFDETLSGKLEVTAPGRENGLPFEPVDKSYHPCFCCLTVLNLSPVVKACLGEGGLPGAARCIFERIKTYGKTLGAKMPLYAVMGLLGTEDLCIIQLAEDFEAVSGVIDHLRGLVDQETRILVVENTHSVLMLDLNEDTAKPSWGEATAEIHVSLRTVDGEAYLTEVKNAIAQNGEIPVQAEERVGEYDAVIHCPASALGPNLYGPGKVLNYTNEACRRAIYQSETILYQKRGDVPRRTEVSLTKPGTVSKAVVSSGGDLFSGMKDLVAQTARQISENLLGAGKVGQDNVSYVRQGLFRLLKDYMRIASIPFGGTFQHDLRMQFHTALNAILYAAAQYNRSKDYDSEAKRSFDGIFTQIMSALSNSMQAGSQIDRLYFEEQQSHLQNTGAYHKILMAYYGIVKDILGLVYEIERDEGSRQPLLIPLLTFGYTSIVCSDAFESFYEGRPARLVCITMPYQALTNTAKYIGPLVHEIFHYSTPSRRDSKNNAVGNCLAAVAFRQFLTALASVIPGCSKQSGWNTFYSYPQAFQEVAGKIFDTIAINQERLCESGRFDLTLPGFKISRKNTPLPSSIFFRTIRQGLLSGSSEKMDIAVERLYCTAWKELRGKLLDAGPVSDELSKLFALKEDFSEKKDGDLEYIRQCYRRAAPEIQKQVGPFLAIYERVMREVPPDLFDLCFVMYGKSGDEKTRQYLWQIHSSRSDKLYYNEGISRDFVGNDIRIGTVIDYFVPYSEETLRSSAARQDEIRSKLQSWFGGAKHLQQKEEADRLQRYISNNYQAYLRESSFALILLRPYIDLLDLQLQQLLEGKAEMTRPVVERLSGFYGAYYQALDLEDEACASSLFDLYIRIIETYQCQPTLQELFRVYCGIKAVKAESGRTDSGWPAPAVPVGIFHFDAYHPADLSQKIVETYRVMVPDGAVGPLWFRGQRLKGRKLLPGIMRDARTAAEKPLFSRAGFYAGMRRMVTLAKAKILPQGERFCGAEWLAFLQHHGFETNLLDWSEDLHSAMFFAIERWIDQPEKTPEDDAAVTVLSPALFNLAINVLEFWKGDPNWERNAEIRKKNAEYSRSLERLCNYLSSGTDLDGSYAVPLFAAGEEVERYRYCFDLQYEPGKESDLHLPVAAMTPVNSDRMKMQAGVFTFCDLHARPKARPDGSLTYSDGDNDLDTLQERYFHVMQIESEAHPGMVPHLRPFLCKIILWRDSAESFIRYVRAIGMNKYRMYPEIDKLAKEIARQAF